MENKLQQNNVKDVWTGMNTFAGLKAKGIQGKGNLERANELKVFFPHVFSTGPQSDCKASALAD